MKWDAPLQNKEEKRYYAPSHIDREHTFSYENSNKCWNINDLIIYLWFNVSKNVSKRLLQENSFIINDNNKCFVDKCMWKEYLINTSN